MRDTIAPPSATSSAPVTPPLEATAPSAQSECNWWEGFKRRNPELETKAVRKWLRNKADHINIVTFVKMYNKAQSGLIKSGCRVLVLLEELMATL